MRDEDLRGCAKWYTG